MNGNGMKFGQIEHGKNLAFSKYQEKNGMNIE